MTPADSQSSSSRRAARPMVFAIGRPVKPKSEAPAATQEPVALVKPQETPVDLPQEKSQPKVRKVKAAFAIGRPPKPESLPVAKAQEPLVAVTPVQTLVQTPVQTPRPAGVAVKPSVLQSVPVDTPPPRKVGATFVIGGKRSTPKNQPVAPVVKPPEEQPVAPPPPVKKEEKRAAMPVSFMVGKERKVAAPEPDASPASSVPPLKSDASPASSVPPPKPDAAPVSSVQPPKPDASPASVQRVAPDKPRSEPSKGAVTQPGDVQTSQPVGAAAVVDKSTAPAESGASMLPETFDHVLKPDKVLSKELKQGNKQRRYLAQSVVLEESGLSALIRLSMMFMAMVLVVFFVWSYFATMDEMAPTTGQVMPAGPVQNISHLEGGIIKQILVKEGDLVEEGQILFRMAPESALAELNQMRARLASLEAQFARNQAFLEEKEPNFSAVPQEFSHLIRDQTLLLTAQRAYRESRRDVLRSKLEQRQGRIANLIDQKQALERQLEYFDAEVAMRRAGVEKGVMSRLAALNSERDRSRVQADFSRANGDLATARKELEEADRQLVSLDDELRQDALKELGAISGELSQLREGMLRQANRVERLEVRAPVKGVIKNLQMETLRGVVPPGGHLTEIVPVDVTRKVETRINTRDIGHVKIGQLVTVKVSTYDFSRYGGIDGVLESISATTFKDPGDPVPYYKGIIRLDHAYVGVDPKQNEVLPGMSVQADIHTGSKTLMEYMLKPIYASVNKAFRER